MIFKDVILLTSCILLAAGSPISEDKSTIEGNDNGRLQRRNRRQTLDDGATEGGVNCDFGTTNDLSLCGWTNSRFTQLKWDKNKGEFSNFKGGPQTDTTFTDDQGGFGFLDTSMIPPRLSRPGFESGMLLSSQLDSTPADGTCVKFWYMINGQSPERLRVLLHPMSSLEVENFTLVESYDGSSDTLMWEGRDESNGVWMESNILYTSDGPHQIIFEAVPKRQEDPNRSLRGFIALDDIEFADASVCGLFCTFEGGICQWTQDSNDEFDWSLSRGSSKTSTGPIRDVKSYRDASLSGGYAFINSDYPRRPGDMASLMSIEFEATDPNTPLCLRFWTHMYGHGIGTLRVLIRNAGDGEEKIIWSLSGEAGNDWYQGQSPISSTVAFRIIFQGVVGENNLGDIGIDDITVTQGACPSAPQVAAGIPGGCTFELDLCSYRDAKANRIKRFAEISWVKTFAGDTRIPNLDHTKGTNKGHFLMLPRDSVQRAGDRAWLISQPQEGDPDQFVCISFWYFLYEPFIDPAGPGLGSLKVHVAESAENGDIMDITNVWALRNHQGQSWKDGQVSIQRDKNYVVIFEGFWGSSRSDGYIALDDITFYNGRCTTKPEKATVTPGDCDFSRDSCKWMNTTTDDSFRWILGSRLNQISPTGDKNFGGMSYLYFDVFNQNGLSQTLQLVSPTMPALGSGGSQMCMSFWYAAFGSGKSTILTVQRQDAPDEDGGEPGKAVSLWERSGEISGSTKTRPEWQFGQVEITARSPFQAVVVGKAKNGGFAIDHIRFYNGGCRLTPEDSVPNDDEEEDTTESN